MFLINSGVEQLAARKAHNLEVGGSSPPPAPKNRGQYRYHIYCPIFYVVFEHF